MQQLESDVLISRLCQYSTRYRV